MTNCVPYRLPAAETADAIRRLCECLTQRDKDLLKIERNGQIATVEAQLVARWWNYRPRACAPAAFKAQVLQILATHGRLLDLLEKIQQQDIFTALLDPENYKTKNSKKTKAKTIGKRLIDTDSSGTHLTKSIARTIGGDGAINRAYDYGTEWDQADRQRLDDVKLNKSNKQLLTTETGIEDDTPLPKDQDWIDKEERLDRLQARRLEAAKATVQFKNIKDDGVKENNILLFDAQLAQSTNATSGDTETSTNTFLEDLRRQNFDIVREQIILADAINRIQEVEFVDIREKLYKYFDSLFYYDKGEKCRY